MDAQMTSVIAQRTEIIRQGGPVSRLALVVLFMTCGFLIFVFGSPYFSLFWSNRNLGYMGSTAALSLAAALWLRRTSRASHHWQVAYAFFTASCATVVILALGSWSGWVTSAFDIPINTSSWTAINKLCEVLIVIVPIFVLTKLAGADLGSIYVRRGDLKWGLGVGILVLFNFAASAFLFFAGRFTNLHGLGAAVGWGLIFALSNAFMEELWLRGIFLEHFLPLLGTRGSIVVTSIVFASMHGGATYLMPLAIPFIVANTFTLGLACAYLMLKTNSIWGATLIHAASDLFLFIALLASA